MGLAYLHIGVVEKIENRVNTRNLLFCIGIQKKTRSLCSSQYHKSSVQDRMCVQYSG